MTFQFSAPVALPRSFVQVVPSFTAAGAIASSSDFVAPCGVNGLLLPVALVWSLFAVLGPNMSMLRRATMHEMRKFPFGDRSNVAPHVKDWRRHQEKICLRGRIGSVVRTDADVGFGQNDRPTDTVHLAINCRRAGRWLPAPAVPRPRPRAVRSAPNDDATESDLGLPANGTYCAIRDSARRHFVVRRLAKCPDASYVFQETAVSNSCLDRGRGQKPSSSSSLALVGVSWSRLSARALPSLNESIFIPGSSAGRTDRSLGRSVTHSERCPRPTICQVRFYGMASGRGLSECSLGLTDSPGEGGDRGILLCTGHFSSALI